MPARARHHQAMWIPWIVSVTAMVGIVILLAHDSRHLPTMRRSPASFPALQPIVVPDAEDSAERPCEGSPECRPFLKRNAHFRPRFGVPMNSQSNQPSSLDTALEIQATRGTYSGLSALRNPRRTATITSRGMSNSSLGCNVPSHCIRPEHFQRPLCMGLPFANGGRSRYTLTTHFLTCVIAC